MTEVWEPIPGVKAIELDMDVEKPVRCFLLENIDGYYLVDTGYRKTVNDLLRIVEKYMISKTVLTHLHLDHSGGASAVKANKAAKLVFHEKELHTLRQALKAESWLSRIFQGEELSTLKAALSYLQTFPEPDAFAYEGMMLGSWRVLHTPGHTPGHVVLVGEEAAITGDLILGDDTSNVAYVPIDGYHPLSDYLKSLVRVARLNVSLILPAHGAVFKDCRPRVKEIFSHHFERLSQTAQALRRGMKTSLEVANEIKWSKGSYSSLGPFDKWLAILETLSHLDFLAETGYAVQHTTTEYSLAEDADWKTVKKKLTSISDGLWSM
ncbi:MAG: MBL fold metallo-hydrolase [Candidatus Caldarchaeum sp.]